MIFALDTNIISYYLQKNLQIKVKLEHAASRRDKIIIPPSVFYEIKRGFKHKAAPGKEFAFSLFYKKYGVGEMDLDAWEAAASIYANSRKTGRPIEDTDILIAAFCVVNNYTLVTNNTKHFEAIEGLRYEDWT